MTALYVSAYQRNPRVLHIDRDCWHFSDTTTGQTWSPRRATTREAAALRPCQHCAHEMLAAQLADFAKDPAVGHLLAKLQQADADRADGILDHAGWLRVRRILTERYEKAINEARAAHAKAVS